MNNEFGFKPFTGSPDFRLGEGTQKISILRQISLSTSIALKADRVGTYMVARCADDWARGRSGLVYPLVAYCGKDIFEALGVTNTEGVTFVLNETLPPPLLVCLGHGNLMYSESEEAYFVIDHALVSVIKLIPS